MANDVNKRCLKQEITKRTWGKRRGWEKYLRQKRECDETERKTVQNSRRLAYINLWE